MTAIINRRTALGAGLGLAAAPLLGRAARAANPVKVGVLTDMSGPYVDSGGPGSVLAAKLAAADFGGSVLGRPIEIVVADTQNKPDVAGDLARQWYDAGVDAITDLPVTPVAAAVQQVAKAKKKTVMITAAAVTAFTQKLCGPTSTHWADDTHALTGAAAEIVRQGGTSWYFITVDFTFGTGLEADARKVIEASGGKVIGASRYPLGNTDFSSQILAAQSSQAKVVGLASVGNDQVNLIKQIGEFGLQAKSGPTLATFLVYITDIHALGLKVSQGLTFASGFYWDQNDSARAFAKRFSFERKAMPTRNHASIYTATLHFLRAMAKAGTDDAMAVNRAMRVLPVDYMGRPGSVRPDGRVLYDLSLYRVKAPGQSKAPWDYYTETAQIPASVAFAPMLPACAA